MPYLVPTNEELKKFYLCALRVNQVNTLHGAPCSYCGNSHFVPVHANESHLIIDAKQAFLRYLENEFQINARPIPRLETSSIVILGSN